MRVASFVALASLGGALCSCSSSSSPHPATPTAGVVTQSIGPEGGTIEVGGAVVTFPNGAVATSTTVTISVQGTTTPPEGFVALSKLFESEPSGRTPTTEAVYVGGAGRIVHGPTLPSATGSAQHVFLMVPDHLGSTAAVIDRDIGEVVERTTQQAYGAPDSDYRPERWAGFREPYQFTGKEDDFEVGLTYFGARYYHAALGRFPSADRLTIHGLGGDSNPYAYVRGAVLSATDPFGLDCSGSIGKEQCAPGSELPPPTPSGGGGMGFFQSIAALFGGFGGG